MTKRSAFRFVPSSRSGHYSVWRGETVRLGYVTKVVHRIGDRGATRTVVGGWTPSTADGTDLASAPSRAAAAQALWTYHQMEQTK